MHAAVHRTAARHARDPRPMLQQGSSSRLPEIVTNEALKDAEVERSCVYKLSQFEYSAEYDARVLQEALMTARAAAESIPNAQIRVRFPILLLCPHLHLNARSLELQICCVLHAH